MPTIDNPAFNQTLSAIWGNDTKNATLDDFDGPGIVGGLTAMFKGAAPVIVIVFGFLIAFVMYVKYDGSLLIPGMCFMATGCISGGLAYSWGAPIEMIVFCIFLIICGLAGALYEAIVGKQ
jgi:MFS family permease